MKKILFGLFFFVISTSSIYAFSLFDKFEAEYQSDADIIRLQHFDYYAQLLEEYHQKTGYYPFQKDEEIQNTKAYVFLMPEERKARFKDTNPEEHLRADDSYLFEELSRVLERPIQRKYDPQKYSTEGRPNYYIYLVTKDRMFFAIHLNTGNTFTKQVAPHYFKFELSDKDVPEFKLFSYSALKNNDDYKRLVSQKAKKQNYLDSISTY